MNTSPSRHRLCAQWDLNHYEKGKEITPEVMTALKATTTIFFLRNSDEPRKADRQKALRAARSRGVLPKYFRPMPLSSTTATAEQGPYRASRTDASDAAFRALVVALDKDLAIRDGKDHAFFAQYNGLDDIKHVVVVMEGAVPVGCGAFKAFGAGVVEVKRMYVPPVHRQRGIASLVLRELERWAHELGHQRCVLETGEKQPEAITLYTKRGYHVIPNYGQYVGVLSSVCFEKEVG